MSNTSKILVLTILFLFGTSTLSGTDYFRIKNRWTGQYLHIQHKKGHVELDKTGPLSGWWSAQWSQENSGSGYFRIKNRWTGQYLHIEHKRGNLELGINGPKSGWWSAQWKKENVEKGYFRLKNKWTKQYMHIEGRLGHVQLNKTGPRGGWWSSQWKFEKVASSQTKNYTLKCRAGGNMALSYSTINKKVIVSFKHARRGTQYGNLQKGECSWVDRALSTNEPRKICQSSVNDINLRIYSNSYLATSRKAPYISKVKTGGTFSMTVINNNRGCLVVKRVLP